MKDKEARKYILYTQQKVSNIDTTVNQLIIEIQRMERDISMLLRMTKSLDNIVNHNNNKRD